MLFSKCCGVLLQIVLKSGIGIIEKHIPTKIKLIINFRNKSTLLILGKYVVDHNIK
jgi:hypothetical protein